MNRTRLADLLRSRHQRKDDRRDLRDGLKQHKVEILALPAAERVDALKAWLAELNRQITTNTRKAVDKQWQRPARVSMHIRAVLAVLMVALAAYLLLATPNLPFPGWNALSNAPFGSLFYVGLGFGVTALTMARPIIVLLDADEKTKLYRKELRKQTSGNRSRYIIRWVWEIWLGGTPWIAIIAVTLDLAFGYVVAQHLVSTFYHPGVQTSVIVVNALIVMSQMPCGGMLWLIRSVSMYGLRSPQEKARDWVQGQIEQIENPDTDSWITKLYWPVIAFRTLVLLGALSTYLWITLRFYGGFLAKPVLTDGEANEVKLYLALCGVVSGVFFAGIASMSIQNASTRKQKTVNAFKDLIQILLSLPVTVQGAIGSTALQTWGGHYSNADGAALAGSYQQLYQNTVGLLFNVFQSGTKWLGKKKGADKSSK